MRTMQQQVKEAAEAVRNAWQIADPQVNDVPEVVITTGSGLGSIVEALSPITFEMSYDSIPHLPASRVVGHAGRLIIGHFNNEAKTKVLILDGRIHGYEGHSPLTQVLPLLIAHELCGSRLAIFTNAAGAINETFHIGQLMLIKDHINFTGESLVSFNEASDFGGANLDMTHAYTPRYWDILREVAYKEIELLEGVYLGCKGAMFETPAEIRAFRIWGADVVGMSTVHEVTAASRLGLDVVGISVITNMAAGITANKLTHQEVLENTALASDSLRLVIAGLLDRL